MTDQEKEQLIAQWNKTMDEINKFVLLLLETDTSSGVPFDTPITIQRAEDDN